MEELTTKRLQLRKLRLEDAERIERFASDYDVAKTTLNIPHPYPEGSAKTFVEKMLEEHEKGTIFTFAIEEQTANELIGLVGININAAYNHGELGYWIGKPYWGNGYGTEAARRVLRFGFNELQLHKIFARAFAHNPGSWRIMEKIGLKYEGTLKEHVKKSDQYIDLVFYGMLKRDFKSEL